MFGKMAQKQRREQVGVLKRIGSNIPAMRPSRYRPPAWVEKVSIRSLIDGSPRSITKRGQLDLIENIIPHKQGDDASVFVAGDTSILKGRCIAVIGTRQISSDGVSRAKRLARELAESGIAVVSGLAHGVDTHALESAMNSGGRVVAVIGTPMSQAYPASNSRLQEEIFQHHLLVSQFPEGMRVYPSNFPARNRTMAFLSDASVIIEASDSSGTLHQAAECVRLGRWLCIANSVVEDESLEWPKKFLTYEKCFVLKSTNELISAIYGD